MDMGAILKSVDSNTENANHAETEATEVTNSEVTEGAKVEASDTTTSVVADENKEGETNKEVESGATNNSEPERKSEGEPERERKVYHRSSNPLRQAQYSAQKWQKKYKRLRQEFDETLADFNKYKDLSVADFQDEEEKQQYLAWKASRQQRLQDMEDDMKSIRENYRNEQMERREEYDRQVYDAKVNSLYGDDAERFNAMDDEWNDVYEAACNQYDPDGVIKTFIRNSNVGPAIKNVIYSNPDLQSDLFEKVSGNRMIDASERMRILRGVEASVIRFLQAGDNQGASAPVTAPKAKYRVLPHLPPRKDVNSNVGVGAKNPNVTGSLTKTETGGPIDSTSEVGNLYNQIFGN